MFKIITSKPLVGQELKLSEENVSNWDELTTVITDDQQHEVTIIHNNTLHLGTLVRYTEEDDSVGYAVLMDRSLVLPSEICIKVDVDVESECTPCCTDEKLDVTRQTKLAVLDSDGCIAGYITIEDILGLVEMPTLCDLLPTAEERNGDLVARDRILTISGRCNIKAVKQSDLTCE